MNEAQRQRMIDALSAQYQARLVRLMGNFTMCPEVAAEIRKMTHEYLKDVEDIQTKELT